MFIGKVTGTVVATQKIKSVVGKKLLLVQSMSVEGDPPGHLKPSGRLAVAVDTVGAGEGELVLVTQGSSARQPQAALDLTHRELRQEQEAQDRTTVWFGDDGEGGFHGR